MALDHNDLLANAILAGYATAFPAGSFFYLRTGAQPGAENAATGIVLVKLTLPATPWGTPAAGVLPFAGIWQSTGLVGGVAAHWRLTNAADTRRLEGAITNVAGDGPLKLQSTSIHLGQLVTLASFNIRLP